LVRQALDPAWWAPWIVFLAFLCWWRSRFELRGMRLTAMLAVVWIAAFVSLARPTHLSQTQTQSIPAGTVLVCAGDSLTSGVDIRSDNHTYAAELRRQLSCPVINAGIANDKTRDLLKRLQKDVVNRHPSVVVVFIGGNDYLDSTPRAKFDENLDAIAEAIAATGARIVLVEVPTGIVWNPYAGVYRKIASRYGATLVPETMLRLWFSAELIARDHLSEPLTLDGIHLSPGGARRVAAWLQPYILASFQGL
jgi:lysophospholipase L1-like esterase